MTDGVSVQSLLRERVAEEVRALLARKMMTGADLATAIGRSPMYVSRRLRGEVAFDLDDMERLADVFGVGVSDLLPKPEVASRASQPPATAHYPGVTVRTSDHHPRPRDNRPSGHPGDHALNRTGRLPRHRHPK
jgi:transcriptional regulator with XRE-family HTH domain